MALYSIKFIDRTGRLLYEHIEQFVDDRDALIIARTEADAIRDHPLAFEIWCGDRRVPVEQTVTAPAA